MEKGPTYDQPLRDNISDGADLGFAVNLTVNVNLPIAEENQKYSRPHSAAVDTVTHGPFLIQYRNTGTAAYPNTRQLYHLYPVKFPRWCAEPKLASLLAQQATVCDTTRKRVAYYVFTTTQRSYLQVDAAELLFRIYPFDVRTDSAQMLGAVTYLQPCVEGTWGGLLCNVPPGTYTLAIYAGAGSANGMYKPTIYIDSIATSRFDHARNTYDFGPIRGGNVFRSGRDGDINPEYAARKPSSDWISCNTAASGSDPVWANLGTGSGPCALQTDTINNAAGRPFFLFRGVESFGIRSRANSSSVNQPVLTYGPRRNLWYSFVIRGGGRCGVAVYNVTPGSNTNTFFQVFESDEDATLTVAQLRAAGRIDSTIGQGLRVVANTGTNGYCTPIADNLFFLKSPCDPTPRRYYVVVEAGNTTVPLTQIEVAIAYDSVTLPSASYDHFSTANVVNGLNQGASPYTPVALGSGQYSGDGANLACTTADSLEQEFPTFFTNSCGTSPITGIYNPPFGSVWYKIEVGVTGLLKFKWLVNGAQVATATWPGYKLFRQLIPTDTGMGSLSVQTLSYYNINGSAFGTCVTPGTYYLYGYDCSQENKNISPQIYIEEQQGDFCHRPVVATINGPSTVRAVATVNCHTRLPDYGEDGSNMSCLVPNGQNLNNFRTTWFRFDVNTDDTLDMTPQILAAGTDVNLADVRYRILYGDCDALNVGSCFSNGYTVNTFDCLTRGSYFVQVTSPRSSSGNITFQVISVPRLNRCLPANICLPTAQFGISRRVRCRLYPLPQSIIRRRLNCVSMGFWIRRVEVYKSQSRCPLSSRHNYT